MDSARAVAAVSELVKEPDSAPATIEIPAELERWKQSDMAAVARVQARIREEFTAWFARGYAAIGVKKVSHGQGLFVSPVERFLARQM